MPSSVVLAMILSTALGDFFQLGLRVSDLLAEADRRLAYSFYLLCGSYACS